MEFNFSAIAQLLLALLMAPLAIGVINRTKAFMGGRHGRPFLQLYWDIFKLLRKGTVYSQTTTWVIRLLPWGGLAAILSAMLILPLGPRGGVILFPGDFFAAIYLLAMLRVLMVLGALDTGSPFEGMGASREVFYSALLEPALVLALTTLAYVARSWSISTIYLNWGDNHWAVFNPILLMVLATLFLALLVESCRVPIDDPETHLELTMIHEVMILDCGGPDLGVILYTAALKFWLFASLIVGLILPRQDSFLIDLALHAGGVLLIGVVVGLVESTIARLRLVRIPQLLMGAIILSAIALTLAQRS
jgi:formate hydrogenlyase subunit 4